MNGIVERLGYSPWFFFLCIVVYIIIHVEYHYMGENGKTWEMRKKQKKVKKNRTPLWLNFVVYRLFFPNHLRIIPRITPLPHNPPFVKSYSLAGLALSGCFHYKN